MCVVTKKTLFPSSSPVHARTVTGPHVRALTLESQGEPLSVGDGVATGEVLSSALVDDSDGDDVSTWVGEVEAVAGSSVGDGGGAVSSDVGVGAVVDSGTGAEDVVSVPTDPVVDSVGEPLASPAGPSHPTR